MKTLLAILLILTLSIPTQAKPPMNANAKSWLMGGLILGGVATASAGAFVYGKNQKLGYSLLAVGGTFTLTGALLNIKGNGCRKPHKF